MFSRNDNLLVLQHIRFHRACEVLDKHRRAATERYLIHTLRIEQLSGSLSTICDAIGDGDGDGVIGTELDVGVQQIGSDTMNISQYTLVGMKMTGLRIRHTAQNLTSS